MLTYFGIWKYNIALLPPPDPKFSVRMSEGFLALLKQQMQSGILKEAYTFLQGNEGYLITGDVSEETLRQTFLTWSPYVTSEIYKTVPLMKSIETLVEVQRRQAAAFTALTV